MSIAPKKTKARVAYIDIETSPIQGYTWGMWDTDLIEIKKDWYMLSFGVKWGEGKTNVYALPDFKRYKTDKENDRDLAKKLWEVLNDADVVVAHNGDRFDIKKSYTRFIYHKLKPPKPFKSIDTLKIARSQFGFTSNKLDDLAVFFGLKRKIAHTGKHLWFGCMAGNMKDWKVMKKYNGHDVDLLFDVYNLMRSWHPTHPNLNISLEEKVCPVCTSTKVQSRGVLRLASGKVKNQYACVCGKWFYGKIRKP